MLSYILLYNKQTAITDDPKTQFNHNTYHKVHRTVNQFTLKPDVTKTPTHRKQRAIRPVHVIRKPILRYSDSESLRQWLRLPRVMQPQQQLGLVASSRMAEVPHAAHEVVRLGGAGASAGRGGKGPGVEAAAAAAGAPQGAAPLWGNIG